MKPIRSDYQTSDLTMRGFAKSSQDDSVINLTYGEPAQPTPACVKDEAIRRIQNDETLYSNANGIQELRETISDFYQRLYGVRFDRDDIIITTGSTQSLTATLLTILDPGDEVIIPTPCFMLYQPSVEFAHGTVVEYSTVHDDFQLNREHLEALITPRTKAIFYTSPQNPTGVCYTQASQAILIELAQKYGLYIISDDIYELTCFETPEPLFLHPEIRDHLIISQSFSKAFAMTGWRLGWIIAPHALTSALVHSCLCMVTAVSTFSQYAAIPCFSHDQSGYNQEMHEKCELTLKWLDAMAIPYVRPQGAFYVFADVSSVAASGDDFVNDLLANARVRLIPGSSFGPDCEAYVRISFSGSREDIDEGMRRMAHFIQQ